MTVIVRLEQLCVRYGREMALENINLDVRRGETLAIIGESGSGKSTLALALASLLPTNARISGNMEWLENRLKPGCDIGFLFQDPASSFDPLMTVGAQLVETIRAHAKIDRLAAKAKAVALCSGSVSRKRKQVSRAIRISFRAGRNSASRLRSPLPPVRAC